MPRPPQRPSANPSTSDARLRDEILSYLEANSRWFDARRFETVLLAVARDGRSAPRIQELLDLAGVQHGSHTERRDTLAKAIVDGRVTLPHGTVVTREAAMATAAMQGLSELQPIVEKYQNAVAERWQAAFRFATFPILFDLGRGAEDREDALRLAANQLARLSDSEFADRMEHDGGFQEAVLQVAEDACMLNPYLGERNGGCGEMQKVLSRQTRLVGERGFGGTSLPQCQESRQVGGGQQHWLNRLKDRVPAEGY